MLVRNLALKRGSSCSDDDTKYPKKTVKWSRAALDFTGEAELKIIQDEDAHLRAQEDRCIDLGKYSISVGEQTAKTNNELMKALVAKLNWYYALLVHYENSWSVAV